MQRVFAIFAAFALAFGCAAHAGADETRLIFTTISPAGSTAAYNGLSPQIRKVLDDNSGEAQTRHVGQFVDQLTTAVQQKLESDPNQRVVALRPDLQQKWNARAKPMIDAWANIDDAHRKVVEAVRKYAAEFAAAK
jgi:TRAP-type C4-dicarboxylate transport system substrate-binding protein